jgi:hypothetical protein
LAALAVATPEIDPGTQQLQVTLSMRFELKYPQKMGRPLIAGGPIFFLLCLA